MIFAPVPTGLGAADCVMERSAACTVTFAELETVDVLFPLALTVSVITVPLATPLFTVTTTLKVVELPLVYVVPVLRVHVITLSLIHI